ncbi:hypothetical protein NA57DRAFT_50282 [Rhizodiscina lignyota]|uniref:Uncharacterized protein n=1 Tax=Rhizodiscina lignyota TaxID=1504668 RepID=A0A9P4M434_9PEZI|nr:hypothetical protein NA57DRAFT_50282 [Rhizodiscina lignyota]
MAPVEPSFLNSNAGPLAQLYTQIAVAGTLLAFICGNISNAHLNVPPAQHTRSQHTLHRRGIIIFATLALLGLVLSAYFAVARRVLSYRQWAEQGGENVPGTLWTGWYTKTADGKLIPNEEVVWQLGRWMQDTNIWVEGDSLALTSAKAWWWTQQQFAASLAWSAYVGIEARRRHMPTFTIMSFIVLSSLVGLNVAQNLFYIALLLTPDTAPSDKSTSDPLWAPIGGVQAVYSVLPSLLLAFTPHLPSALTLLTFQRWILPLLRANISIIVPKALKHRFNSTGAARRSYTPLFSILAVFALVMHIQQTFLAFGENTPRHRRSHFRFIWGHQEADQSYGSLERAGLAAGKVLDVLHTHPAISAAAWDVLLSAFSFCIYAAVRGIDPSGMLKYSLAPWLKLHDHAEEHETSSATKMDEPSKSKRGRKPSSSASNALTSSAKAVADAKVVHNVVESEDAATAGEAAALGWGLFVLGGLGVLSAAVCGADG